MLPYVDPEFAGQLVGAGRRVLAKELHPDAGGAHHDFVRLSEVTHWLTCLIGSSS